jgi:Tfp pilus assembly PilM family ATPase
VQRLVLAGGGSQLLGLDSYLSQRLSYPVEVAQPLRNIATAGISISATQSLQYATALGLARRALVKITL